MVHESLLCAFGLAHGLTYEQNQKASCLQCLGTIIHNLPDEQITDKINLSGGNKF